MSRKIRQLTIDEFLFVLDLAIEIHKSRAEPIPSFQKSKLDQLESCLCTPFFKFDKIIFYRGLVHKASILFYLLVRNHVLSNGNKRMACLFTSYFCFVNGYNVMIPEKVFYDLAHEVVVASENDKERTLKKIEKTINKYKEKRKGG